MTTLAVTVSCFYCLRYEGCVCVWEGWGEGVGGGGVWALISSECIC